MAGHLSDSTASRGFSWPALLPLLIHQALAYPVSSFVESRKSAAEPEEPDEWGFIINISISVFLVLLGGVFAGLTLGLMGQDEVYLQVVKRSSDDSAERRAATRVLNLLSRGKHWVLVTLLLGNVITNETLPIVLDRCLGGGWYAVVSSTVLIVIFGEVIPQSVSVRYGLKVGAFFTPFVLLLMYIMYPVAYPTALLLDHILGQDHGTMYKRAGLKTLVTLHQTMGVERLNEDEVTIISSVLDLKQKDVQDIMTPIEDTYTMSADRILNEETVDEIFKSGYSRIPIHVPGEPYNFIGMLLVRVLISYDPDDCLTVSSFPLATLPETGPDTSCLKILNYFQEGKAHMVVVSETPGASTGALGVITLEDVIEELIGEEIVDESDVYVDVHNKIKRSPNSSFSKHLSSYLHSLNASPRVSADLANHMLTAPSGSSSTGPAPDRSNRESATPAPLVHDGEHPFVTHGKVVKPSNPAANPILTSKTFVTIKKPEQGGASRHPPDGVDGAHLRSVPDTKPVRSDSPMLEKPAPPRYGSLEVEVHPTESSAVNLGIDRNRRRNSGALEDANRAVGMNLLRPSNSQNSSRLHSYKAVPGGFVESVVTVDGVAKTIIEDAPSDNDFDHVHSDTDLLSQVSNGGSAEEEVTGKLLLDSDEDHTENHRRTSHSAGVNGHLQAKRGKKKKRKKPKH